MKKTIRLIINACLLLPLLANAQAEQDAELKWYQVELFIYANSNPDAANQELWSQDLDLKYPANVVSLQEPTSLETQQAVTGGNISTAVQAPPDNNDTSPSSLTNASQNEEQNQSPPAEQPFITLPPEYHELAPIAKRILSKSDFRLLLHKAWRQPISNKEAGSILIRAGDQFDSHYELEGTINLSVERYLHINTDLWLSTFVSNVGRQQEPWPVLPKAPITLAEESPRAAGTLFDQRSINTLLSFDSLFTDISSNQYAVERTITLRQHRRMRSNELHYIDHPLMGLLIKITPYELPVLEQEEETEPGNESPPAETNPTAAAQP